MKNIIQILVLALYSVAAMGQSMNSASDSDPAATKILDKLKKEYDTYKSMEVDFDLILELPGQEAETQKGKVVQQGEMYFMDMTDRAVYTNAEYVWVHIKKNNEVQINDVEEDDDAGMLSPKDMLKLYETGEYVYVIVAEPLLDGKKVTQIEFKPLDRDSEFFKMTLYVDKKSKKMSQMKVFSKDGSRYTLKINDITPNKKYDPATFIFDESKFPGIHVEDLRID